MISLASIIRKVQKKNMPKSDNTEVIARALNDGFCSIGKQLVIAFQQFTDELKGLKNQLARINERLNTMAGELDQLTADVKKTTDTEDSAILLLQGLSAQIAANAQNPAALQALSAQLSGKADELAAAVVANTPAAPSA